MNRYIAKETMTVRTVLGKRITLIAGAEYDGGFDFRDPKANRSVLFVDVDGVKDEVHFEAGSDFIDKFHYLMHVNQVVYQKRSSIKRPRISK